MNQLKSIAADVIRSPWFYATIVIDILDSYLIRFAASAKPALILVLAITIAGGVTKFQLLAKVRATRVYRDGRGAWNIFCADFSARFWSAVALIPLAILALEFTPTQGLTENVRNARLAGPGSSWVAILHLLKENPGWAATMALFLLLVTSGEGVAIAQAKSKRILKNLVKLLPQGLIFILTMFAIYSALNGLTDGVAAGLRTVMPDNLAKSLLDLITYPIFILSHTVAQLYLATIYLRAVPRRLVLDPEIPATEEPT